MTEYTFYFNKYHGNRIKENDWPRLSIRAESRLSKYERTYTITYPTTESRDMAVCALAEEYSLTESATASSGNSGGVVKSVSIGSVSTSFDNGVPAETLAKTEESRLYSVLRTYADVYRGVNGRCR